DRLADGATARNRGDGLVEMAALDMCKAEKADALCLPPLISRLIQKGGTASTVLRTLREPRQPKRVAAKHIPRPSLCSDIAGLNCVSECRVGGTQGFNRRLNMTLGKRHGAMVTAA